MIEYRPAVVMVYGDREVSVIRSAEDLDTLCAHEHLPDRLRCAWSDERGLMGDVTRAQYDPARLYPGGQIGPRAAC